MNIFCKIIGHKWCVWDRSTTVRQWYRVCPRLLCGKIQTGGRGQRVNYKNIKKERL